MYSEESAGQVVKRMDERRIKEVLGWYPKKWKKMKVAQNIKSFWRGLYPAMDGEC